MLQFKKAEKSTSLLRCAIFGPPGAGKTFSSLRIATGMGGRIAVIDTERGSASKYADKFEFDVLDLPDTDINTYVAAMEAAAKNRYDVLIIDSMSHAWQELLSEVDRLATAKYRGNTWGAWSEGTPKQRKLVNALLSYPGHIIATMRSKIEYSLEQTKNGKSRPVKVGLAPEQGKGIEYEFDLLLEVTQDHYCTVSKDRTGKFQDKIYEKPDETLGQELISWLMEGKRVLPNQKFIDSVIELAADPKAMNEIVKSYGHKSLETIYDRETQTAVYKAIRASLLEKQKPQAAPQAPTEPYQPKAKQTPPSPTGGQQAPANAPVATRPTNANSNPMDQKTKDFLKAMGNVKSLLNQITGDDSTYYNTMGAQGYSHANEIFDGNHMTQVYKELQTKLNEIRGGQPNAQVFS